ncbi:DUF488 family protein [Ktedonobacter racemifer]|uniref:DUF488 domain-containing protein n=1 Tax=Ktedonobacter racemifer DSM 44963 TaxID=485913 RepID=D6U8Z8_KTERA|nr:DUF488 family protein [Ktedonobacter racemifer]EFH79553.1 protein of unknown function DUF1130 [Ktedonobacter racemifer DSM 44963]
MSQKTLYTFGYLAGRAERIIAELSALNTPLVDVRFNPDSKNWRYTQGALRSRLGARYFHIRELGNELYKEALTGHYDEPHIKLADVDAGLARLAEVLDAHGRAAIFCACSSKTKCHRIEVARLAADRLGVKVVHL